VNNEEEEKTDTFRQEDREVDSLESKKTKLKEAMGPAVYDYYYKFLFEARTDPLNDEAKMR
jgi:hypothetical protein